MKLVIVMLSGWVLMGAGQVHVRYDPAVHDCLERLDAVTYSMRAICIKWTDAKIECDKPALLEVMKSATIERVRHTAKMCSLKSKDPCCSDGAVSKAINCPCETGNDVTFYATDTCCDCHDGTDAICCPCEEYPHPQPCHDGEMLQKYNVLLGIQCYPIVEQSHADLLRETWEEME